MQNQAQNAATSPSPAEPPLWAIASKLNWLRAGVLVALALSGAISATLGGAPRPRAIARTVGGGLLAMAITYGFGNVVGTWV